MQRISAALNRRTCRKRRPNLTCERFAESRNITPQLMSAAGRRGHSSPSQPRAAVGLHPCSGEYSGFFWSQRGSARGLRGNRGCIPRFSLFAPPPPVVLLTVGVCAFCSVRRAPPREASISLPLSPSPKPRGIYGKSTTKKQQVTEPTASQFRPMFYSSAFWRHHSRRRI
jgi:hypothetical protein